MNDVFMEKIKIFIVSINMVNNWRELLAQF